MSFFLHPNWPRSTPFKSLPNLGHIWSTLGPEHNWLSAQSANISLTWLANWVGTQSDYAMLIKSRHVDVDPKKSTAHSAAFFFSPYSTFTFSSPQLMETLIRVLYLCVWALQSLTIQQSEHSLVVICLQPAEMAKICFAFFRGSEMFDSSLPFVCLWSR